MDLSCLILTIQVVVGGVMTLGIFLVDLDTHLLMAASSRITARVTKLISFQTVS